MYGLQIWLRDSLLNSAKWSFLKSGGVGTRPSRTMQFHIHTHAIQTRLVALCISKSATKNSGIDYAYFVTDVC